MCVEYGKVLALACGLVLSGVLSSASAEDSWDLRLSPLAPVKPLDHDAAPVAGPQVAPTSGASDVPAPPPLDAAEQDRARPGKPTRSHDGISPIRFARMLFLVKDALDR